MKLPIIALVGKPNVGKSSLFNRLSNTRNALVSNISELTRDRQYTTINLDDNNACILIDTGGITEQNNILNTGINHQVEQALTEADLIFFMVSAKEELSTIDINIATKLRKLKKPIMLLCNKSEAVKEIDLYKFYELGLGNIYKISAEHGLGIKELKDISIAKIKTLVPKKEDSELAQIDKNSITITILGRPNVGKSTLTNRILGDDRVLVMDNAGTTRDSIYIPFLKNNKTYTIIDTAGIRRKKSVVHKIEKFSIIKTINALEKADIAMLILDAQQGITGQDASLLGLIIEKNRALILVVNKWDGIDEYQKQKIKRLLDVKLSFISHHSIHFISALHGSGVGLLFNSIDKTYLNLSKNFSTSQLNKVLENANKKHPAPLIKGRRIRLKFINQIDNNPITFMIYGNQIDKIPANYHRYLVGFFKQELQLTNIPIVLEFKNSDNPYKNKNNTLNQRQKQKKHRL